MTACPVVAIRGLATARGGREIISGLDLEISAGEVVALLGRSGCGKSTLLRTIAGLDAPDAADRFEVPDEVGLGFQEPRLLPWKRVRENVALGLRRASRLADADRALAEVGLASFARAWPLSLSGGEAQRVSLARAVVREPPLLLLDEPFSALDALTRRSMHALLRELQARHGPAVLIVTHDVDEALALADRVVLLDAGRISLDARAAGVTREQLLSRLGG